MEVVVWIGRMFVFDSAVSAILSAPPLAIFIDRMFSTSSDMCPHIHRGGYGDFQMLNSRRIDSTTALHMCCGVPKRPGS